MFQNVQLFAHICALFARFYTTFVALKNPKSCSFPMLSCTFCLVLPPLQKNGIQKCTTKIIERCTICKKTLQKLPLSPYFLPLFSVFLLLLPH